MVLDAHNGRAKTSAHGDANRKSPVNQRAEVFALLWELLASSADKRSRHRYPYRPAPAAQKLISRALILSELLAIR
jgi:hypothetical protein